MVVERERGGGEGGERGGMPLARAWSQSFKD